MHKTLEARCIIKVPYAAFRLSYCWLFCCFDGDICTTAQAPLPLKKRPSGPKWQTIDNLILFNFGAMLLSDKAKVAWPLRAVTLKWQAMITLGSGNAAKSKVV